LKHVAVKPERAFAEDVEIDHGPEAAADETLNLDGAAIERSIAEINEAIRRSAARKS
jgi:hypothetical protein